MTLRRTTTLPSPPAAHTPAHTATYTPHPSDIFPSTTEGTAVLRASMHARTPSRQRLQASWLTLLPMFVALSSNPCVLPRHNCRCAVYAPPSKPNPAASDRSDPQSFFRDASISLFATSHSVRTTAALCVCQQVVGRTRCNGCRSEQTGTIGRQRTQGRRTEARRGSSGRSAAAGRCAPGRADATSRGAKTSEGSCCVCSSERRSGCSHRCCCIHYR